MVGGRHPSGFGVDMSTVMDGVWRTRAAFGAVGAGSGRPLRTADIFASLWITRTLQECLQAHFLPVA